MGNWITNYCIDKNDYVKPVYDVSENVFWPDKEWSLISSSYHTKIATGLINLYSVTKQKIFRNAKKYVTDSNNFKQRMKIYIISIQGRNQCTSSLLFSRRIMVCRYLFKGEKYLKASKRQQNGSYLNQ